MCERVDKVYLKYCFSHLFAKGHPKKRERKTTSLNDGAKRLIENPPKPEGLPEF